MDEKDACDLLSVMLVSCARDLTPDSLAKLRRFPDILGDHMRIIAPYLLLPSLAFADDITPDSR
jgi:hypothetical protein